MKEINSPKPNEQPSEKPNKKPEKKPLTREEAIKRDKIKTYVIYGVIIAAILAYVIYTIASDTSNKNNNNNSQLPESSTATSNIIENNPDEIDTSSNTGFIEQDDNKPEVNEHYEIPSNEHVILYANDDKAACYVYIPTGYIATVNPRSVTLKPENLDIAVTGNNAISVHWSSVMYYDTLKTEKHYDDELWGKYKKNSYEVIHEYDFVAHSEKLAHVYIIKHEQLARDEYADQLHDSIVYTVVLDIGYNGLYPCITLYNDDVNKLTTNRYPDIISLTEAMFMPIKSTISKPNDNPESSTTTDATTANTATTDTATDTTTNTTTDTATNTTTQPTFVE